MKLVDDIEFSIKPYLTVVPHLRHHMVLPKNIEEKVNQIKDEFSARERLSKYNLFPTRKLLIHGESGFGKSMLSEYIAWSTGLTLLKLDFTAFLMHDLKGVNINDVGNMLFLIENCDFSMSNITTYKAIKLVLFLLSNYKSNGMIVITTTSISYNHFGIFDNIIHLQAFEIPDIVKLLTMTISAFETDKMNLDDVAKSIMKIVPHLSPSIIVKIAMNAMKTAVLSSEKLNESHLIAAMHCYGI
jgi:hypothetical protein